MALRLWSIWTQIWNTPKPCLKCWSKPAFPPLPFPGRKSQWNEYLGLWWSLSVRFARQYLHKRRPITAARLMWHFSMQSCGWEVKQKQPPRVNLSLKLCGAILWPIYFECIPLFWRGIHILCASCEWLFWMLCAFWPSDKAQNEILDWIDTQKRTLKCWDHAVRVWVDANTLPTSFPFPLALNQRGKTVS